MPKEKTGMPPKTELVLGHQVPHSLSGVAGPLLNHRELNVLLGPYFFW